MARRRPGVQLSGLDAVVESLEGQPETIRRATRAAINDQGRESKQELAQRIARDGISRAKAGGQINLKRATNKEPVAVLAPTSRRIPFKFWKTTKSCDLRTESWLSPGLLSIARNSARVCTIKS
mgnify:CR=1 FL=1